VDGAAHFCEVKSGVGDEGKRRLRLTARRHRAVFLGNCAAYFSFLKLLCVGDVLEWNEAVLHSRCIMVILEGRCQLHRNMASVNPRPNIREVFFKTYLRNVITTSSFARSSVLYSFAQDASSYAQ
jgi:hypothetical protein